MKTSLVLTIIACVFVVGGCTQAQEDQAQQEVSKGAQSALDKTKEAVGKGWKSVEKTTSQISETTKIKNAVGSSDVDTSNVSIDTIGKTIYMIGNVPTQAMKDKAEKIAKDMADAGYAVENDLKVGPVKDPEQDKAPS